MDPVSALGVASAVLALVERAVKTGRDIKRIYDSADGIREKEKGLLEQSEVLDTIVKGLQDARDEARNEPLDERLREISSKCALLSLTIQNVIDKCQRRDKSVVSAAMSVARLLLHQSDIDDLQKELEKHQTALTNLTTTRILCVFG
jgi:hypothetical protein